MKAVKEALSPTRVKLTVEVPFDELRPSLASAYRKLAKQVKVQGFRPGKVPPQILDQRLGRGTVLDEALQEALPRFYGEAAREQSLDPLGRPEVDITSFADGAPLVFTAEVDVRPEIELPDYERLPVVVDEIVVSAQELDEQIDAMRERFAVLEGVERPAQPGDYVTLDLTATVDGEEVDGATTSGLSYEVGSANLIVGLDEAITGAGADETRTFPTTLVAGDFAGREAQVSVVVRSVKRKVLPAVDDDFATTASEFDSLDELRADVRERLTRVRRMEQALAARERVLDVLLERTEVALPESVVAAEVEARLHSLTHQLEEAGLSLEDYLEAEGKTREQFDAEVRHGAERNVGAQLVLDAVVTKEQLEITQADLTEQVLRRAQRAGVEPQAYAAQLSRTGQVPALALEVARGKALALVLEAAEVTDSAGAPVDLVALGVGIPAPGVAGPDDVDDPGDDDAADDDDADDE